jgi:hypothetical protein
MRTDDLRRDDLLAALSEEQAREVKPVSPSMFEQAMKAASAERDSANANEHQPLVAPTLRFQ